ncbi:MAG: diadenylate cyclase [Methanimicrococcus sp.]|nr:diadenylate cyclase [Methanimicrococcus sp.]
MEKISTVRSVQSVPSSREKRKALIEKSAADMAIALEAKAVFTFGTVDSRSFVNLSIPVIDITQIKNVIEKLSNLDHENLSRIQNLAENVRNEADKNTSLILNAAAVEYILGRIDSGCVIGVISSPDTYSILVHNMEENENVKSICECEKRIKSETLQNVLNLSLDIAMKGREGKKIGTAFIIGDEEEVMSRSHQIILNPFRSQDSNFEININKKENRETVIGFAQLDGIFVLSGTGKILAAGRYLDVDTRDIEIDKGLGTRHLSCATITRDTNAVAVVISESGGTIRIYMDGKEIMFIEPSVSLIEIDGEKVD